MNGLSLFSIAASLCMLPISGMSNSAMNELTAGQATLHVRAILVQPVTLNTLRPLNFGTFIASSASQTVTVNASDGGAAQVVVDGPMGTVQLQTTTQDDSVTLTQAQGNAQLEARIQIPNQGIVELTGNQPQIVSIGGDLTLPAHAAPGYYTGSVTLTVSQL